MGTRPSDELLGKYFDAFKHFSTVSVALGVITLVIFRDSGGIFGIMGTVILLTVAFVLSLLGMLFVVLILRAPAAEIGDRLLWWLLAGSGVCLLGAVPGLAWTALALLFL